MPIRANRSPTDRFVRFGRFEVIATAAPCGSAGPTDPQARRQLPPIPVVMARASNRRRFSTPISAWIRPEPTASSSACSRARSARHRSARTQGRSVELVAAAQIGRDRDPVAAVRMGRASVQRQSCRVRRQAFRATSSILAQPFQSLSWPAYGSCPTRSLWPTMSAIHARVPALPMPTSASVFADTNSRDRHRRSLSRDRTLA